MPNINLGRGGSGVSGQMQTDIEAMSDPVLATRAAAMEANTAQNLKAATTGQGTIQSLNDQAADHIVRTLRQKELKDLDPTANRNEYMLTLSEKIVEMEKKAKDVEKSGTGNVAAKNTYFQVAQILKKRLYAMQNEDAGVEGQ